MSRNNVFRRSCLLLAAVLLLALNPSRALADGDLIGGDAATARDVNYKTAVVKLGTFTSEVSADAARYYPLSYELRYDHADAKFVEYKVHVGNAVKAGDVLAEFRLEGSEAELARLELTITRTEEETARGVRERQEQIDEAREALEKAQSRDRRELRSLELQRLELELERYLFRQNHSLEQQRAELDEAREEQNDLVLTAPFDGVITRLASKNADDAVSPNEVLIILYSEEVMFLRVENGDSRFRYNMPVKISVGSDNDRAELTGRVIASDDLLEKAEGGYALIQLDPYDESILLRHPRATAQSVYLENVLTVSRDAVKVENGREYVTKLTDGMVQKRYVTCGLYNLTEVWIVLGVSEGETLIVD